MEIIMAVLIVFRVVGGWAQPHRAIPIIIITVGVLCTTMRTLMALLMMTMVTVPIA